MRRPALLAFALAIASVPAVAQTPRAPSDEPPPTVVTLRTTALEFGETYLVGTLTKPNDSYSVVRKPVRFRNLIELRGNFRPELARSASKLP